MEGRPDKGQPQDRNGVVGESQGTGEERGQDCQRDADGELDQEGRKDRVYGILSEAGALLVDLAQCAA